MTDSVDRICYNCKNHRVCALRRHVDPLASGREFLDYYDVNLPGDHPASWIQIFRTLAVICKYYSEEPK